MDRTDEFLYIHILYLEGKEERKRTNERKKLIYQSNRNKKGFNEIQQQQKNVTCFRLGLHRFRSKKNPNKYTHTEREMRML